MMPHIIGKQKSRIRAIEETHNVQLESNQQNTDTTKIKIQGISKEETEEAKKEIEKIIEKRTNEEYLKEKYTNTICHQFQRNQCKFGTQCWYKHPTAEKEKERRAPPRSILRSPLQTGASPGFGRGGGQEFFFSDLGICMSRRTLLGGFGGMLPQENC